MLAHLLLEWCEVTPSSKKLAVLLATLGAFTVLMYGIVIGPRLNQVTALQEEIEQLDHALRKRNSSGQEHERLTAEVSMLRRQYQTLSEALGIPLAVTEGLSGISKAASQAGLSLTLWKPEPADPAKGDDGYGIAVRLEVKGNYHGLARFLDELARLPKALAVKAFSITAFPGDQAQETILASLDLFGYESTGLLGPAPSSNGPATGLPIREAD